MRIFLSLLPTVLILSFWNFLPTFLDTSPVIILLPLVILSVWSGGFLAGLTCIFCCTIFIVVVFRNHLLTFPVTDVVGMSRIAIFFFGMLGFITLVAFLQKALIQAKHAVAMRDEFISLTSHELKTPVASLKLQIEMAKQMFHDERNFHFHPFLETFNHLVSRLERQVSAMLDLTLIETNQIMLRASIFDLDKSIRDVASTLKNMSEKFKTELVFTSTQPVMVEWDQLRIEQVASNIIHNAIKYGEGKTVEIFLSYDETHAWFSVKDQGKGIPLKDQKKIFQRYVRVDTQSEIHGNGLGLYLSHTIVQIHGGEITVKSEAGKGSEFIVKIPIGKV